MEYRRPELFSFFCSLSYIHQDIYSYRQLLLQFVQQNGHVGSRWLVCLVLVILLAVGALAEVWLAVPGFLKESSPFVLESLSLDFWLGDWVWLEKFKFVG